MNHESKKICRKDFCLVLLLTCNVLFLLYLEPRASIIFEIAAFEEKEEYLNRLIVLFRVRVLVE
jgi:hypothetical protein